MFTIIEHNTRRKKIKHAYQRGVNFMDKFDRLYRNTIGARVSEATPNEQTNSCVCTSPHLLEPIVTPLPYGQTDCGLAELIYPPDMNMTCEVVMGGGIPTYTWRHKDSDGVVLAESQMDIPQATFGDPTILRLNNSTHMCVRNDENTRIMLESVLGGGVGDFFFTKKKTE